MNTYTLHKDQKKITLTPLKSAHSLKPKNNPHMDVFLTTLLKSQLHEYETFKDWILYTMRNPNLLPKNTSYLTLS